MLRTLRRAERFARGNAWLTPILTRFLLARPKFRYVPVEGACVGCIDDGVPWFSLDECGAFGNARVEDLIAQISAWYVPTLSRAAVGAVAATHISSIGSLR
jgi:hypothetical protein